MPNVEHLPALIIFVLVSLVAALGIWYLSIQRNIPRLKMLAVMICVFPLLGVGLQVGFAVFGVGSAPVYRTSLALGSDRKGEPGTNDVLFEVNDPHPESEIELTPKVWGDGVPTKPVTLHYAVRSPQGVVLAEGDHEFDPTSGLRWATWDLNFQPRESGEHKLVLTVPNPVGRVDINIRELR
jgi:hypothetical protein